jgi:hypothetical protein
MPPAIWCIMRFNIRVHAMKNEGAAPAKPPTPLRTPARAFQGSGEHDE